MYCLRMFKSYSSIFYMYIWLVYFCQWCGQNILHQKWARNIIYRWYINVRPWFSKDSESSNVFSLFASQGRMSWHENYHQIEFDLDYQPNTIIRSSKWPNIAPLTSFQPIKVWLWDASIKSIIALYYRNQQLDVMITEDEISYNNIMYIFTL